MKKYEFNINNIYVDKFFSPIRNKTKVIETLLESIKYMILSPVIKESEVSGRMVLNIDKMSRLFFYTEEKFFSIVFPFSALCDENRFKFVFNGEEIDSRLISQVLSIIRCDEFSSYCSLDFIDPISEYENEDENFWVFLKELLLMESGYIRYDYDIDNYEKFKSINKEHVHPMNHYDVFYSGNATFKLGLDNSLEENDFIDLLNIHSNCKYLT